MFWVVKLLLYNLIPKLWITSATNAGDTPIFTNPKGYVKAEEIYKENGKIEYCNNYLVKIGNNCW